MADETPKGLTPANENPWYVLATLYGEQTGKGIDWDLHARNRRAWNGWACQDLSSEERAALAKKLELKDEDLKPWSQSEKEEIEALFNARLPGVNVPDPTGVIDCSEIHFSHTVLWEKCIFGAAAHFGSATFSADADFGSATFSVVAYFISATFSADADFGFATFSAAADFDSATFSRFADFSSATFSGIAHFRFATFSGTADFIFATFSDAAYFSSATFSGTAHFSSAMFSGTADFIFATFSGIAHFSSATFSGTAHFSSATFSDAAGFISATFSDTAYFNSATFSGRIYFVQARFVATEIERESLADFSDTAFEQPLTFREVQFGDAYPSFAGALLPQNVTFSAADLVKDEESGSLCKAWPDPKTVDQDQVGSARASCATIRHAVAQQGLPEEEHFFFRKEMAFAARDGALLTRLPYILFGWISNFGYSIARPTIGLVLLWVLGFAAFWGYLASCCVPSPETVIETPFYSSIGLSFSNIFPFFGFRGLYFGDLKEALPAVLKFLSGVQTIGGFVCLFFLGLGLRTRFRLR